MAAVSVIGDLGSGHGLFLARPSISGGSPNVLVNKVSVLIVGSLFAIHTDGNTAHPGTLSAGSSKVLVNGVGIGRVGDTISCGSTVAIGSATVLAG